MATRNHPTDARQMSATSRTDEFLRLLSEHDREVLLYILSLVPNWNDAEEIRQETHVKLWQEFDKFQSDSDFGKWARTIARYEVLTFRTRAQRRSFHVSQRSIDLVAAEVEASVDSVKPRQMALTECVNELSAFNRELVRLYYTVGRKIKEIAGELRCSPDAAYKALQRTRADLRLCVDRKIGEGESS
jgi:RNA polymerase sigma-70 factor (ECF subfamily)